MEASTDKGDEELIILAGVRRVHSDLIQPLDDEGALVKSPQTASHQHLHYPICTSYITSGTTPDDQGLAARSRIVGSRVEATAHIQTCPPSSGRR